jgi:ABC-2 type transport system ATP-binding protein
VPDVLTSQNLALTNDGRDLVFTNQTQAERIVINMMLSDLGSAAIRLRDLQTTQSSLEDIFVGLVSDRK